MQSAQESSAYLDLQTYLALEVDEVGLFLCTWCTNGLLLLCRQLVPGIEGCGSIDSNRGGLLARNRGTRFCRLDLLQFLLARTSRNRLGTCSGTVS